MGAMELDCQGCVCLEALRELLITQQTNIIPLYIPVPECAQMGHGQEAQSTPHPFCSEVYISVQLFQKEPLPAQVAGCAVYSPFSKLFSALWPELSLQRFMARWFILLEGCPTFAGVFSSPRKVMLPRRPVPLSSRYTILI